MRSGQEEQVNSNVYAPVAGKRSNVQQAFQIGWQGNDDTFQTANQQYGQQRSSQQVQQQSQPQQNEQVFGQRVVKKNIWEPSQQSSQVQNQSNKNQSTFSFGDYNYFQDGEDKKGNLPNKNQRKVVERDAQDFQQQQYAQKAPYSQDQQYDLNPQVYQKPKQGQAKAKFTLG